jgi:ATP-dependent protease Clp ATPase subunit
MGDEKLCSFCEKPQDESDFFVEGPKDVSICGECIGLCATMILDARGTHLRMSTQYRPVRPVSPIKINDHIDAPEVLVLGSDGNKLGVFPTVDALRMAKEQKLDLVLINPKSEPPVCKILDFRKYRKPWSE